MAEEDQEKFKREFGQIKSGNPKHKSEMQLYTIKNVKTLYDSRQKIIDLFINYSKIKSESIYRSKHRETKGKGLKIKNRYSFELLTSETMKLFGGTKNKVTKDKNGENVPYLEITEVVLVHFNIVNNDYQQD